MPYEEIQKPMINPPLGADMANVQTAPAHVTVEIPKLFPSRSAVAYDHPSLVFQGSRTSTLMQDTAQDIKTS